MINLLRVALAAYRLARMVSREEGPFSLFMKLRLWAGVYDKNPQNEPASNLGRLFDCPHCTGVYGALASALMLLGARRGWVVCEILLDALAGAGMQSLVLSLFKEQIEE